MTSTKKQTISKSKIPMTKTSHVSVIEFWSLVLFWDLIFVIWYFPLYARSIQTAMARKMAESVIRIPNRGNMKRNHLG